MKKQLLRNKVLRWQSLQRDNGPVYGQQLRSSSASVLLRQTYALEGPFRKSFENKDAGKVAESWADVARSVALEVRELEFPDDCTKRKRGVDPRRAPHENSYCDNVLHEDWTLLERSEKRGTSVNRKPGCWTHELLWKKE